jgi:hypothetical protein
MTATNNDTPVNKDKEVLMEVRGIIDGVLDSGSTDYKAALKEITCLVKNVEKIRADKT